MLPNCIIVSALLLGPALVLTIGLAGQGLAITLSK